MLRIVKPMPVAEFEVRVRHEGERSAGLAVPALPSLTAPTRPPEISVVTPPRVISPQAVETELVRLENQRAPSEVTQLTAPPPRMSEKRVNPRGYRPIHLSYEASPVSTVASYQSEKKVNGMEDLLWRVMWILCLVFVVFAVIALLVKSYNLL